MDEPGVTVAEIDLRIVPITRVTGGVVSRATDAVAVEEPLEIRVEYGRDQKRVVRPISITMRTPGHDVELAAGFLYTEGIVTDETDISAIRECGPKLGPSGHRNVVSVTLRDGLDLDTSRLERHFYTTSSCGVCGKASLDALDVSAGRPALTTRSAISAQELLLLPDRVRREQAVFGRTGGIHAAAIFNFDGELLCLREDVGRHNALDKLVGAQLLQGDIPLADRVLLLSGRASFELLQKAFMAGIAIVAAVGAPSSLAVELAERFGITLIGWLRPERFSIYSHPDRVSYSV